jgi:hypothetical protein
MLSTSRSRTTCGRRAFGACGALLLAVLLTACGGTDWWSSPTTGAAPPTPSSAIAPVGGRTTEADATAVLAGTYRFRISRADFVHLAYPAGFTAKLKDLVVRENVGAYTWRLRDGRWHLDQTTETNPTLPSADGTYDVTGDVITFHFPAGLVFDLTIPVDGPPPPRAVVFQVNDSLAAVVLGTHPWTR